MLSNLNILLVTVACWLSFCLAIRVDWNTNTGPIIPPTPRTTVRPVPPFREPAPVWEDSSNDIANPNPYIYVPPPPSRPKQRLNTNVNYNSNDSSNKIYGTIVTPQNANTYYQQNNNNYSPQVASLSPQYIPNVGTQYVAVVPTSMVKKSSIAVNKYPQITSENSLSPDEKTSYKLQGKYNVKTKKYKAYEKVKYVPLNYYSSLKPINNTTVDHIPLLGDLFDLPAKNIKQQQRPSINDSIDATVTSIKPYPPIKSYTKHLYSKDKSTILKPKEKINDFVDKADKS